ncbi:MAG: porin family protein [Bacteroidota bacterium]
MFSNKNFRRLTLLLVFTGFFSLAFSQKYGRHPFDMKRFNLGFIMGFNYNAYNLKEQIEVEEDGILLKQIKVNPRPGFSLGMISSYNVTDFLSFRFIPTISLEQRDFDYNFANDSLVIRRIDAAYFNMPIMAQWKTKYWRRTRVYVLTGGQVGFNLNSNKKVRNDMNLLKVTTQDVSLVFGFGLNIYGDRVKLSPEIRYSLGLINIYEPEFTSHAQAIGNLTSQVLTLQFNFE